jgi:hypothetical protein
MIAEPGSGWILLLALRTVHQGDTLIRAGTEDTACRYLQRIGTGTGRTGAESLVSQLEEINDRLGQ